MPACAGATPSAAPVAVRAGRLMSMPKGRQGDEKAQQQGEGHGGRRNTHQSQILWLADLCQRHLNARRSAIDIEHPGRIPQEP